MPSDAVTFNAVPAFLLREVCMKKKRFILRRLCIAASLCTFAAFAFSQTPAPYTETAVRCIDIAKNLLANEEYEASYSRAALGLTYDNTVADLYYIQALGMSQRLFPPYKIEPLLKSALQNKWYEYNKDAARLLLASLYTKTARVAEALSLLNERPLLSGKDALYIRANALYLLGNIGDARKTVRQGALQFPEDPRFALLFFERENRKAWGNGADTLAQSAGTADNAEISGGNTALNGGDESDKTFAELSSLFVSRAYDLQDADPDVLLKASLFAFSEEDRRRLLKAWNAYGKTDPRYAVYALKAGLMSEEKAFDYVEPFFSGTSDYALVKSFVSLVSGEKTKESVRKLYAAFAGTLCFDTNGDGISDMTVTYRSGRPSLIEYDANQDGIIDWTVDCDYGVPVKVNLVQEDAVLWYGTWPSLSRVIWSGCTYTLNEDRLFASPVNMIKEPVMEERASLSFYLPVLRSDVRSVLNADDLFALSHTVERKSAEGENTRVRFSLFDGKAQNAVYTDNGTPYAYAFFENGALRFRNVDRDKNGTYELTEIYAYADEHTDQNTGENALLYRSAEEARELSLRLFGVDNAAKGLYLQKVVSDTDGNGIIEFSEEYGPNGKTTAQWNDNKTGSMIIRYVKNGDSEETEYVHPVSGRHVRLIVQKGVPVSADGIPVVRDEAAPFFWIGDSPGGNYAQKVIKKLNQKGSSDVICTVTNLIWLRDKDRFARIFAVKNGDMYFGELLYE